MRRLLCIGLLTLLPVLSAGQSNRMVLTADRLQELEEAAAAGDSAVQGYLASLYFNGFSLGGTVVEDRVRAATLALAALPGLERQATGGDPMSEFLLGTFYEHSIGVPRDRLKAQSLFRQAAQNGLTSAQREYALSIPTLVSEGSSATPAQATEACAWMTISAENGNHMATSFLADTCAGVEPEKAAAMVSKLRREFPKVNLRLDPSSHYTPFEPRK